MVDRLRAFLDSPLDPRAGRAILVGASAIVLGLAALFVLATSESDRPGDYQERHEVSGARPVTLAPAPTAPTEAHAGGSDNELPARRQDPQDRRGSPAATRAARALRSHRALQHVPYRSGEVRILLVGARGSRALLRVSAPSVRAARQDWGRFLRRFDDAGRAYLPLFTTTGKANG